MAVDYKLTTNPPATKAINSSRQMPLADSVVILGSSSPSDPAGCESRDLAVRTQNLDRESCFFAFFFLLPRC